MIDQSAGPSAPAFPATGAGAAATGGRRDRGRPAVLSRRPGAARALVLLAAFVCAACGLVYELELVTLGGYLLGDSVTQASVVLSMMVFAMGVGSLMAKRLTRRPAVSFAIVESALALLGGLSGLTLYVCWAWLGQCRAATVCLAFLLGLLIGAEIPLLMTLIQRIRRQDAGRAVADLFAADYVGALAGGLAFPFLLLPAFGQATGALVTGGVNAVAGAAVVLWLFRDEPAPQTRLLLWTGCGLVLAALAAAAACTGAIERAARRELYGAHVRVAEQGRYQEIVLTGEEPSSLRLFLDGRLAVCGADRHRHHEALVQPAMAGPHSRVLVLGGGDGLAAREVLQHRGTREAVVVEGDPVVTRLARSDPALSALSGHSLGDPRVRVVSADPLGWLRGAASAGRPFDVILADLPEPGADRAAATYSEEFLGLASRLLAPAGRIAVDAGPLGPHAGAERRLWVVEASVRAVGLRTVPYSLPPTASGCGQPVEHGFLLAARQPPALALASDAPPPRSLDVRVLRASAARLAAARPAHEPSPATVLHPMR